MVLAMDSNHPRRLHESRVLPTEQASLQKMLSAELVESECPATHSPSA
jgi:hypothetical protein